MGGGKRERGEWKIKKRVDYSSLRGKGREWGGREGEGEGAGQTERDSVTGPRLLLVPIQLDRQEIDR
jgi:hypothetical protein